MAITFVAAGTKAGGSGTTIAPGLPAGAAADDIFLELVHCSDISAGTLSGPSPWHQLANFGGTGRMGVWWVRRDESSPGTTVTSSVDPAGTMVGGIAGFRGVLRGGYPFSAVGTTSTGTDSSIEHDGITPLVDDCMLVLLNGSHDDVSRTLVGSYTNILEDGGAGNIYGDTTGTPDASCHMSYLLQTTAAATGTVTQTQGASVGWGSILVALRPEPAAQADVNFLWQADGGASVTLRADIADGDAVIVQIFRDGSNSLPGAINGDTSWDAYLVASAASDSSSYRLYARVLGTGEAAALVSASLTSGSATQMHVGVWRPESGYTLSIGGIGTSTAGSGTDFPFPTLTFTVGDGTSHVIAGGMHRSANGSPWLEPSGFINRGFVRTTTARVVFHESDGGLSSWAGETVAIGATSSQRRCWSVELVVTAAGDTVDLGQASETDSALASTVTGGAVTKTVSIASETDSALAATATGGAVTVTAGIASETDSGLAATPTAPTTVTAGIASETDSALAATTTGGAVTVTAGIAAETDTALTATPTPGAVIAPASFTYVATTPQTNDATTYTFTGVTLRERALIGVMARANSSTVLSVSSVLVDGVAASAIVQVENSPTNANVAAIYAIDVGAEVSASIQVTFSRQVVRCGLAVGYGDFEITATDSDTSTAADPSVSLSVPAGGVAFGVTCSGGSTSVTWTGLTEDLDVQVESASTQSAAHQSFVAAQTVAITANYITGSEHAAVFASFAPGKMAIESGTALAATVTGGAATVTAGLASESDTGLSVTLDNGTPGDVGEVIYAGRPSSAGLNPAFPAVSWLKQYDEQTNLEDGLREARKRETTPGQAARRQRSKKKPQLRILPPEYVPSRAELELIRSTMEARASLIESDAARAVEQELGQLRLQIAEAQQQSLDDYVDMLSALRAQINTLVAEGDARRRRHDNDALTLLLLMS